MLFFFFHFFVLEENKTLRSHPALSGLMSSPWTLLPGETITLMDLIFDAERRSSSFERILSDCWVWTPVLKGLPSRTHFCIKLHRNGRSSWTSLVQKKKSGCVLNIMGCLWYLFLCVAIWLSDIENESLLLLDKTNAGKWLNNKKTIIVNILKTKLWVLITPCSRE